ncbi:hypothetical protein ACTMU2_32225 [Cupriavidus basilensis]
MEQDARVRRVGDAATRARIHHTALPELLAARRHRQILRGIIARSLGLR